MRVKLTLSTVAALAAMSTTAQAFAPRASDAAPVAKEAASRALPKIGIRVVRPELRSDASLAASARGGDAVDALSGAERLMTSGWSESLAPLAHSDLQGFIARALAVVSANRAAFGVDTASLVLDQAATLLTDDDQFLSFLVQRDGLRIQDASIEFRFKKGRLLQVVNHTFSEARADERPSEGDHAAMLRELFNTTKVQELSELYRVVQDESGYRLARVRELAVDNGERFVVQVEAATGEVYEIRPTHFEAAGKAEGMTYARNYNDELVLRPYSELTLTVNGSNVQTAADGAFQTTGTATPKLSGFKGKRVNVRSQTGAVVAQDAARDQDGSWNFRFVKDTTPKHSDAKMAQSMIYQHVTAIVTLAKTYVTSSWLESPLTANANLSSTCNAHWDGSTINFYKADSRCANTGLISDVVYHEWGHGLDAKTGGIADGGFSEGYGDVLALVMTGSNVTGAGFFIDGRGIRDLEPNKVYPRDSGGEVHAEGLIIGGTFYDLWKDLKAIHGETKARDLLGKYAFKVIFTARRYTDVYNALLAIDDDNGSLSDGTPNFCSLNKAFSEHGLATRDSDCG